MHAHKCDALFLSDAGCFSEPWFLCFADAARDASPRVPGGTSPRLETRHASTTSWRSKAWISRLPTTAMIHALML